MIEPSRASAFFRQIVESNDPAKLLSDLVQTPLSESEFVEYKGASGADFGPDEIKRIWSKALSAFGNTGGGVVIFGIHAKNNKPTGLSLVADADDLKKKLLQLQPRATEPPVVGVEVQTIRMNDSSPQGFVVCHIPPSPWRPHAAIWAENRYYIRAGDNCEIAPHSLLKALFQPTHVSALEVFAKAHLTESPAAPGTKYVRFNSWLYNHGPGTARDIVVLIEAPKHCATNFDSRNWSDSGHGSPPGYGIVAERPFHPTEMYPLIHAEKLAAVHDESQWSIRPPFDFSFRVFSENQPPINFDIRISEEDIVVARRIKGVARI